ncbi:hypothetical protein HYPSUDRAFT_40711 [Hypholoma sublateritium FD-334 SS-4]|uniref:G domain-containing protein n=1 Tax=Hypholoma sublateritium (strain FD-334 SS-4) TaxID=945553 RepID=A0A0D2MGB0_HYPSF|nr:hypothetical protein HYPSUDRAFT_40711 [Hypholoma sublateritium FD-334 SS-4]
MQNSRTIHSREVFVALMGPTGTGKSTFINLLTNNDNIRVGHDLDSQTTDVGTSVWLDKTTGLSVTLIDTPGFDDSRSDITDTDILQRIATYLQENGGRMLNGIIYLHRISDPRVGGAAKKNLRVFRELCGDEMLGNVRLVTTNWSSVGEKEGNSREAELANRIFKPLIDAGAKMLRHDKGLVSAQSIMSTLIQQIPGTLKIQTELNSGRALGDTSAGAVIIEEIKALQKKHAGEMEDLMKEMQEAAMDNDKDLRADLAKDRQQLEQLMERAEENQRRLATAYVPQGPPPQTPQRVPRQSDENGHAGNRHMGTGNSVTAPNRTPDTRTVPLQPANAESDTEYANFVDMIGDIFWDTVAGVVYVVKSSLRM